MVRTWSTAVLFQGRGTKESRVGGELRSRCAGTVSSWPRTCGSRTSRTRRDDVLCSSTPVPSLPPLQINLSAPRPARPPDPPPASKRSRKIRPPRKSWYPRLPRSSTQARSSTQTGRFARLDQGKASIPHHPARQPPRHREDCGGSGPRSGSGVSQSPNLSAKRIVSKIFCAAGRNRIRPRLIAHTGTTEKDSEDKGTVRSGPLPPTRRR